MSAVRIWLAAAALSTVAGFVPIAIANADCTTPGDFGAGSGCAPPSSGSGNAESWPPTSVDWPPQLKSDSDSDSDDKDAGSKSKTPIVMPYGEKPPPATTSTSTSAKPTPIVVPQH
ncbi:hypothetical protein [Mycobacterium sp. 3519A]|uniref:hypothetical protein n=1 Tax=Mycobacterium sp. 3519A TaxID=2057184 RepID=UPI001158EC08|nr:hypothetical protein [Mycobacterium sp. 3519A]